MALPTLAELLAENPNLQWFTMKPPPPDTIKQAIKCLGPNSWLLGPSLLCERHAPATASCKWADSDGSGYTLQRLEEGSESLGFILPDRYKQAVVEPHPLSSKGPVKLLKQINHSAVWKVGEWGVFKTKPWTAEKGTEAATMVFVKEKFPNIPIPTVFEHHEDSCNNRSYLLMSWVRGQDLKSMWKQMDEKQRKDVLAQVAGFIYSLAQIESMQLATAEGKKIYEPYLVTEKTAPDDKPWLLLDSGEIGKYEKIWGADYNKCVFYHADLGPTNIKIEIQDGEGVVVGLLDWEVCGFMPIGWVATKPFVSDGYTFEWGIGEFEGRWDWSNMLGRALEGLGFKAFGSEWRKWFDER